MGVSCKFAACFRTPFIMNISRQLLLNPSINTALMYFLPAVSAKIVMLYVAIFHVLVAVNIIFYSVRSSRDSKICRKFKFRRVRTTLSSEFCFLHSTLRFTHEIEQQEAFMENLIAGFAQFCRARAKTFINHRPPTHRPTDHRPTDPIMTDPTDKILFQRLDQ